MTSTSSEPSADLSPSAPHSLASLFEHRRATWREALDGSAALLASCFAAAAITAMLVRFSRHRRKAS